MVIKLLKHQKDFVEEQEHEVIMLTPPRAGKTFAQLYDANGHALKYSGSTQVYMCKYPAEISHIYGREFLSAAILTRKDGCYHYENGSKVYFARLDNDHIMQLACLEIDV